MASKITAPVEGFTGTVVGVDFRDGVGETDNPAALAYFARQGYKVAAPKAPAKAPKEKQAPKAPAKASSTPTESEPAEGEKAAE